MENTKSNKNDRDKEELKELILSNFSNRIEGSNISKILNRLLDCISKVDFQTLSFPEDEENQKEVERLSQIVYDSDGVTVLEGMKDELKELNELKKVLAKNKLTKNHYLIICVEQLIKIAEDNQWGLCKKNSSIYLYNSRHWKEVEKELFQAFLGNTALKMGVEKFKGKIYKFREELFKQFLSDTYLPEPENKSENILINVENGTYEISATSRILREHRAEDFITYILHFKFDKDAKAPLFQKFLDEVLPDKDKQKVLAEYLGSIFIKPSVLKLEKILILFGTGANGKSVFFLVLNELFGKENTSNFSLESLTDTSGYTRAKIGNKLVNYSSEISGKLESSYLKQIASGEPIQARLPFGEPFILENYAKMIFNCNKLPTDVEHTDGFFRRFMIINFDVTIPEDKQDKELHTKIINTELAGVFNWILEGLDRVLLQRNFSTCEDVDNARKEYENQSDSVKLYLDEKGYRTSATETILISEIYPLYRTFCLEDGYRPVGKKEFIQRLNHHKIFITRINIGNVVHFTLK
jgi:putative DNA primase/helicase